METIPLAPYRPLSAEPVPDHAPFAQVGLVSVPRVHLVAPPAVRIADFDEVEQLVLAVAADRVVGRLRLITSPERCADPATWWGIGHIEAAPRGVGLGLTLYLAASRWLALTGSGAGVSSHGSRKAAATATWERLVRAGYATRGGEAFDPRYALPARPIELQTALDRCWARQVLPARRR